MRMILPQLRRAVTIPSWTVWLFLLGAFALWLLPLVLYAIVIRGLDITAVREWLAGEVPFYLHTGWCAAAACVYGVFRATYFHPIASRAYGRWLAVSPWEYGQPLPAGPLNLVWQDAAVIAVMTAIALLPPAEPGYSLLVAAGFLTFYSGRLCLTALGLRASWPLFIWALLAGGGLLVVAYPIGVLGVSVLMLLPARAAIRVALRDFPNSRAVRQRLTVDKECRAEKSEAEVLWPASPATPDLWLFDLRPSEVLMFSLAVGWILFAVALLPDDPSMHQRPPHWTFYGFAAIVLIAVRLLVYCVGHLPPISLLGRLATRRPIIPGYDQVLVAPLAGGICAVALPIGLLAAGASEAVACGVSATVTAWLVLGLPPRWQEWHYRGHFRVPLEGGDARMLNRNRLNLRSLQNS